MRRKLYQPATGSPPALFFRLISDHRPLFMILLVFTALTVYQSVVLPLGEADDETDHYQYLRFVARTGHPPLTGAERREAGFKGGLAPLYYWLAAWPVALVGEDQPPEVRRVDARPERLIPDDGLGINHVLHTLDEQWPWQGQALAWHLVRFLSLPLGWAMMIATYLLIRRLVPRPAFVALLGAGFVALLPRFVISSAAINDDNLVFALIALLLLVQVMILQAPVRPSPGLMAVCGALFGLTLVTKYFSLVLLPEIIFTLWVVSSRNFEWKKWTSIRLQVTGDRGQELGSRNFEWKKWTSILLPFTAALLLAAGPWFIFIVLRFNRVEELGLIPGLAASLGEPQITEGLVGLLSGQAVRPVAATYPLPAWLGLLYRSFWFEYGWMRVFAPAWVYLLFTLLLLAVGVGLIEKIRINKLEKEGPQLAEASPPEPAIRTQFTPAIRTLLVVHLGLFLVVVLARYGLSATIDTGQGRHLYPALPVIALLVALGLTQLWFRLQALFRQRLLASGSFYLFLTGCYILPALLTLQPAAFVLPHYQRLPVTTSSWPAIPYPQRLQFAEGLSLLGYGVEPAVAAGDVLPVMLYWRADREAGQDYLISLCLQDEERRPAACWRGHFANGDYPARAWEAGDTLVDTVFIPVPYCDRIQDNPYRLYLEVWPLEPSQAETVVAGSPALEHIFVEPAIKITAGDSRATDRLQTAELWLAGRRLAGPEPVTLRQTVSQISYAGRNSWPGFRLTGGTEAEWLPLSQFETDLYLPCEDGPSPFAHLAHFVVEPTLRRRIYRAGEPSLPELQLFVRDRTLAATGPGVTFGETLAPLALDLPDQGTINLAQAAAFLAEESESPRPLLVLQPGRMQLPLTIRWQARRRMAEPLIVALKLLDKDFAVGGERVAALGNRYPNLLWVPGEIVEESYALQLKPDAPPGLYQLEVSLLRQDGTLPGGYEALPVVDDTSGDEIVGSNLYPLKVRLLDPAHERTPSWPLQALVGEQIELIGYDVNPVLSDSPVGVSLALYWRSTAKIPGDYTVFTQLVGPDGQVWAQWDNPPQAGRYPTSAWSQSDRVVDRYRLSLREGAPPGDYRLLVGMYDPASGERLPVLVDGQPQPDQALELTSISFGP